MSYIIKLEPFEQAPKQGVLITIRTNQQISFFIPARYRDTILQQLRRVAVPSRADQRKFDIRVDENNLKRLITYFSTLQ